MISRAKSARCECEVHVFNVVKRRPWELFCPMWADETVTLPDLKTFLMVHTRAPEQQQSSETFSFPPAPLQEQLNSNVRQLFNWFFSSCNNFILCKNKNISGAQNRLWDFLFSEESLFLNWFFRSELKIERVICESNRKKENAAFSLKIWRKHSVQWENSFTAVAMVTVLRGMMRLWTLLTFWWTEKEAIYMISPQMYRNVINFPTSRNKISFWIMSDAMVFCGGGVSALARRRITNNKTDWSFLASFSRFPIKPRTKNANKSLQTFNNKLTFLTN